MTEKSNETKPTAFAPKAKPWWYMSARQIGVAAAFAGMALAITLAHLVVPMPGVPGGGGMDPSEIIRSIGSAIGGPLVGFIIGLFGSLSSIANIVNHIPSTVVIGLLYKFIYPWGKTKKMIGWLGLIALYYIILVPNIALSIVIQDMKGDFSMFVPMMAVIFPGIAPEFVVTAIITTILMGALPAKYIKPLW